MTANECLLCGGEDARVELVRLADPDAEPFAAVARCRDKAACRSRVEASGEPWPLADATAAEASNIRHFSDAHRRVFELARKWRESRQTPA